ncbi:MAG: hypothetical protein K0U52_11210, partial [Gammaproteobacteria bacterium]|nr:hypothetical protein [Gammaproteobacteria bacterium]
MEDPSHFVHTVAVQPATPQPNHHTHSQPTSNIHNTTMEQTLHTPSPQPTQPVNQANMWQQVLADAPVPDIDSALQPPSRYAQAKQMVQKVIESKILVAALVFVFTAILLTALNPPIAQK